MRWVLYGILVAGSALVGHDQLADRAFAVMPNKNAGKSGAADSRRSTAPTKNHAIDAAANKPEDIPPVAVRLDFPIAWQLTRSQLMSGSGSATMTESFRETWTLETTTTGRQFIISPRARVPAFTSQTPGAQSASAAPKTIVVSERDLAQLLGIQSQPTDGDDLTALSGGRPVMLTLRQTRGLDVSLAWSDDVHYAVHLDIGTSPVF